MTQRVALVVVALMAASGTARLVPQCPPLPLTSSGWVEASTSADGLETVVLTATQGTPTAAQERWLKSFVGAWVVDGAVGPEADITVNVAREGTALVLRVVVRDREVVTRYDSSGADVTNQLGGESSFRTHIDGQKLVTEIWDNAVAGPPSRVETRYMESGDSMMTELAREAGAPAFNRQGLRRKGRVSVLRRRRSLAWSGSASRVRRFCHRHSRPWRRIGDGARRPG